MNRVRTGVVTVIALLTGGALLLAGAWAHPERSTQFPDANTCFGGPPCAVPAVRHKGPSLVVCKADSRKRVRRIFRHRPARRRKAMRNLRRCHLRNIQTAVNRARNGTRILVMPGVYKEQPSRKKPVDDPRCKDMFETPADGDAPVPTYRGQLTCPNAHNLIAILGDSNDDRTCDQKCNIQLLGQGMRPRDVLVVGDRLRKDVIRADRADGIVIDNMTAEQAAFNAFDVVETNGFRVTHLVGRWSAAYGILSFASDHGLYYRDTAYGNGDGGIYPGSGPDLHCARYGIEVSHVNSYRNVLGYSGTAGNGTYVHDSDLHDNNAGFSNDSFAPGHPGEPQDCSRYVHNRIWSNNRNFFTKERIDYCNGAPFEKRKRAIVCPHFQVPVGTGMMLYGVNRNLIADNQIWDNWRSGVRLFLVPGALRGDNGAEQQEDTSNFNQFSNNTMGAAPDGSRAPNGTDFTWDEGGAGNCWEGNHGAGGAAVTSDPSTLPECPGRPVWLPPETRKYGQEVPCATWDPVTNPDPPGCTWFTTPAKPQ